MDEKISLININVNVTVYVRYKMNIFVTSTDPTECAKSLDDKRLVKMVLETTQLLSTAMNLCGGDGPYKTTHANHPCSVWVRTTKSNYKWLHSHLKALCEEYTNRYGKIHKCEQYLDQLYYGRKYIEVGPLTPFANCAANNALGLDYRDVEPTTEAYTQYLKARWETDKRKPTWSKNS